MTDNSLLDTLRAHSYKVEPSADPPPPGPEQDAAVAFDDFLPRPRNWYGACLLLASAGVPILTMALLWSLLPSIPLATPQASAHGTHERTHAASAKSAEPDALNVQRDAMDATPYVAPAVSVPEQPALNASVAPPAATAAAAKADHAVDAVAAPPKTEVAALPSVLLPPSDHAAPIPAPALTTTPAPTPTKHATTIKPAIPSAQAKALRTRGDELMGMGDVATARLYFERAADAGDAHAALLAGHTYNPEILSGFGVRGMQGDMAEAEKWYQRAADLGDKDAIRELANLATPPQAR
jgi:hypothetical protein